MLFLLINKIEIDHSFVEFLLCIASYIWI